MKLILGPRLPTSLPMTAVMYGDGRNGYAIQVHRNRMLGVECRAERKNRHSPFVEYWTHRSTDQVFSSYRELRESVNREGK